jgi:hypothetical protein
MPQPTRQTSDVFNESDNVVSLEFLPIPSVTADFMFNLNHDVLLRSLSNFYKDVVGPVIGSGFVVSDSDVVVDSSDLSNTVNASSYYSSASLLRFSAEHNGEVMQLILQCGTAFDDAGDTYYLWADYLK